MKGRDGLGLIDGEGDKLGDGEGLGLTEGEGEGFGDDEGLVLNEGEGIGDGLGLSDLDEEVVDGLIDRYAITDSELFIDGLALIDGIALPTDRDLLG